MGTDKETHGKTDSTGGVRALIVPAPAITLSWESFHFVGMFAADLISGSGRETELETNETFVV